MQSKKIKKIYFLRKIFKFLNLCTHVRARIYVHKSEFKNKIFFASLTGSSIVGRENDREIPTKRLRDF